MTVSSFLTMILGSVVTKLLWAFRYPKFHDRLIGEHTVGAIQCRIPGSTACQIHYPTSPTTVADGPGGSGRQTPYFRPRAVDGLAEYSRTDPRLLRFLSGRSHPCRIDADPLLLEEEAAEGREAVAGYKFPLVIFSHGLGGCLEMYTGLCQQIASCGYCVVAVEHEDGSACFAERVSSSPSSDGEEIPYGRPDDSPYSRQKAVNFRRPFLRKRVEEITKFLGAVTARSCNDSDSPFDHPLLQKVLDCSDTSRVHLVGHSFGGAAMAKFAQEYSSSDVGGGGGGGGGDPHQKSGAAIQSIAMLDCWAFSMAEADLQRGLPSSIPALSILSEGWLTNPETAQVQVLLQNTLQSVSLYAAGSVHASVADSVNWMPGFVTRRLRLRGPEEKRFETVQHTAQACVRHFQRQGVPDAESDDHTTILRPYPIDFAAEKQ